MDKTLKIIGIVIAIGIWAIVLQNAGIITTKQNVYVKGGYVNVDVDNEVDISGSVSVDNEVSVDITRVNGWNAANYYEYKINGQEFHSLGTK